jgi:hypothetical protein
MGPLRVFLGGVVLTACTTSIVVPDEDATVVAATGDQDQPAATTPTAVRLSQTDDNKPMEPGYSVGCADKIGTLENSWYRVFPLAPQKFQNRYFDINRVNFAVQTATGDQRVKVYIGTYGGNLGDEALDMTKVEMLGQTTIDVPPTSTGETLQANFAAVGIPSHANLIVEIKTEGHPDVAQRSEATKGTYIYLGATPGYESRPGYLRAPACGFPTPEMTSSVGYLQSHLIMSVSGTN